MTNVELSAEVEAQWRSKVSDVCQSSWSLRGLASVGKPSVFAESTGIMDNPGTRWTSLEGDRRRSRRRCSLKCPSLLCTMAPHAREYLLLGPTTGFAGCSRTEVAHSTAYAIQGNFMSILMGTDGALLTRRILHCWTPYFGRNFLPSATAALNFDKSDKDNLGGWSAQGMDVYARVARHKITTMQKAEGSTLRSQVEGDPSAETEKVLQLHVYRTQRNVPFAEVRDTLARLSIWKTTLADGILGLDCASASAQRYSARQNSISLTKTWRFCQSHRPARRGEDSSSRKQPSRTAFRASLVGSSGGALTKDMHRIGFNLISRVPRDVAELRFVITYLFRGIRGSDCTPLGVSSMLRHVGTTPWRMIEQ